MKLDKNYLNDVSEWKEKGYTLPCFDREKMLRETKEHPRWIHFGAGNIFRAFLAKAQQQLLDKGFADYGIIAAEGRGRELADKVLIPHDCLTLLVEFGEGGKIKKSVIASIAEICAAGCENDDFDRMREIFRSDSLQLASFTITEKGYKLRDSTGEIFPDAAKDFEKGAENPESFMGKIAALLYERFINGGCPISMVSMDNCADNGGVLFRAVLEFAENWEKRRLAKQGFAEYIKSGKVAFPITMIDKITPRPDRAVEDELIRDGIEGAECILTSKGTYSAAFVNAEETGYLVIEDVFPSGRPPFEQCGFYMTDRETVRLTEKMKVSSCLNPLHTALAVFGCLLGFERICDEAADPILCTLVKKLGYEEGLPAVSAQSIIDPRKFLDEVINVRLPNPHLPDTPQRIATDTSMKVSVRFGENLKYYASEGKAADIKYIPLVIAGWLRYLVSVDDKGNEFERSPDPFLSDERAEYLHGLNPGEDYSEDIIRSILSDENIFGIDLCSAGFSEKITEYFKEMLSAPGAVERTLKKAVGE